MTGIQKDIEKEIEKNQISFDAILKSFNTEFRSLENEINSIIKGILTNSTKVFSDIEPLIEIINYQQRNLIRIAKGKVSYSESKKIANVVVSNANKKLDEYMKAQKKALNES